MCEPISLTLAYLGGVALATSTSVGGSVQEAQTASAMADYQADLEEQNRLMYERQAQDIEAQGLLEKRNAALERQAQLGRLRASMGASGAAMNTGSSLLLEEDAAQTGMVESRELDYDIRTRAWQARLGAWNAGNQESLYRAQSSSARSGLPGSILGDVAGGLVSGASGTASMWSGSLFKETSGQKTKTLDNGLNLPDNIYWSL